MEKIPSNSEYLRNTMKTAFIVCGIMNSNYTHHDIIVIVTCVKLYQGIIGYTPVVFQACHNHDDVTMSVTATEKLLCTIK